MLPCNESCIDGSKEKHHSYQHCNDDDSYDEWPYRHLVDSIVVTILFLVPVIVLLVVIAAVLYCIFYRRITKVRHLAVVAHEPMVEMQPAPPT
ncbi:hypothetical protein TSUD_25130 [Trifolium subterraneum]|uniref:Uncharacterized protein n=1 Tax=Trifolium subterraneum TaxID=3900 RepID=A0A2Z6NUK3_TRISU|nr:hypothetical protein TSUD_25130 [Trifolium subterraneum]